MPGKIKDNDEREPGAKRGKYGSRQKRIVGKFKKRAVNQNPERRMKVRIVAVRQEAVLGELLAARHKLVLVAVDFVGEAVSENQK